MWFVIVSLYTTVLYITLYTQRTDVHASYIIQLGSIDASFQEKDTYVFCSHYVNDLNERDVFHATLIRPCFTRNTVQYILSL
jgi:hypothetical protein